VLTTICGRSTAAGMVIGPTATDRFEVAAGGVAVPLKV
jgi:hypothetical protein